MKKVAAALTGGLFVSEAKGVLYSSAFIQDTSLM
jgi:hypothetical protein